MTDSRFPVVPPVALTPTEHAALQCALLSVRALPSSLSLVPVHGALEVWAKRPRQVGRGMRWVRVQRIPSPPGPGLAPGADDDVQTDFMPL